MHTPLDQADLVIPEQTEPSDLKRFFQSPEWLSVATRYPKAGRGGLLYALTLSGLSPTVWGKYLGARVTAPYPTPLVIRPLSQVGDSLLQPAEHLAAWWEDMRTYATEQGLPLHLPLVAPAFLTVFGYSQLRYLADLQQVVGLLPLPEAYFAPWPETRDEFLQTLEALDAHNTLFARKTVAIMSATANLIEHMVQQGIKRMRS